MTVLVGFVLFGGLWGLSVLATKADKAGPSWRLFGLFWFVLGSVITVWAYRDVKPHARSLQEKFRSALRQNTACEIRVCTNVFIGYENKRNRQKGWYAFQTDDGRLVFIRAQFCQRFRKFPTSDFSMVDIADEKGNVVARYARDHGHPVVPIRNISEKEAARLRTPDHMEIISGTLNEIDTLLGAHP